ncbi:MAG: hypothetical protein WD851_04765 [Pirellulales bacterium]
MVSLANNRRFVLCLENSGYEASLDVRKVYVCLLDAEAENHGMPRVIDETGEDYLFPAGRFAAVELPKEAEAVMQAS